MRRYTWNLLDLWLKLMVIGYIIFLLAGIFFMTVQKKSLKFAEINLAVVHDSPTYNRSLPIETNELNETRKQLPETPPDKFFYLTDKERYIVECIVSGEARGESYYGQMLVAQCILDACLQDNIQPSEVRIKYGYEGWHEEISDETKQVVSAVFDNGELAVGANVLWFYNPNNGRSSFHESQRFIIEEGHHKFFAPKGESVYD